jgi:Coenzyme PQQ synthesis protein D (PqqD)
MKGEARSRRSDDDDTDVVYGHAAQVLSRRVGGDVVVAAAVGEPYILTGTGLTIWNLLRTPRSLTELIREVSVAYGTTPAAVRADVLSFVAELRSRHLAEEVPDAAR